MPGRALDDKFALFFEFLGPSRRATIWPLQKSHDFLDLLICVSQMRSDRDCAADSSPGDGSFRIRLSPEVTIFSDKVVMSYPSAPERLSSQALQSIWVNIICQDAIRIVSCVAEMCLRVGLLIRGGLSHGPVYHRGGIVFGEAVTDAQAIKDTGGASPRIVVCNQIIAMLGGAEDLNTVLKDDDGVWYLNYFGAMKRQGVAVGPNFVERAEKWKQAHLERIDGEMEGLRNDSVLDCPHRLADWEWFKSRFSAATSDMPNSAPQAPASRTNQKSG